mmetsp:Transcript_30925/g.29765  ORF Transcript_30925/g.29765 Transcript_30925/m.29765 type:complete len:122 (-) Transcript_30925:240-605(-)|eukprot:CAMPEP_0197840226 /NCGR_PEP_ID=MMETSP1437-20131217/45484_1 /TAXON_ID=49252 ORGANISM="Eucampia antarctica, Strain CCMP1452" /NCGR_SAMPLE_ID=MMETSP1437 /ASSEMBLY_ACC=CAM_ASM_001096 /LENGTH=121 /DNA_ID=CAMNT_0043449805 /DNA_START=608 /DNA_END=973 /DNA_ORIENTATION=-
MTLTSLADLSDSQKQELVASLSSIVAGNSGKDVTAESLAAIADASGNKLSGAWAALFADVVTKAKGLDNFCAAPGSGGGGGASSGGEAAAVAVVEEEPEEEEADMGGGTDMFGGDEGGGDY